MKEKLKILTSSSLHIIAMLFMLIDHVGAVMAPGTYWIRAIGRLAFPIFAFLIAEGYTHTRNVDGYITRLLKFGLVSEIPFNLLTRGKLIAFGNLNVMFTFAISLIAIRILDNSLEGNKYEQPLSFWFKLKPIVKVILLGLLASVLGTDYGASGVLLVVVFYITRFMRDEFKAILIQFGAMIVFFLNPSSVFLKVFGIPIQLQHFCVLSLPFIHMYNGKLGINGKTFKSIKYWFYPLHMLAILLIFMVVTFLFG